MAETFKRVPTPGAGALRADSGFYCKEMVQWREAHHVRFTITADQTASLLALMKTLPEHAWINLPEDYPLSEVAEFRYQPARWTKAYRYVVKRQLTEKKNRDLY